MKLIKDAFAWEQLCMNFYMVSEQLAHHDEVDNLSIDLWFNLILQLALGFYHMQSAYDRDDYVKIHWKNIKNGTEHNFDKYTNKEVTHFNTTYDYYSIMHYEAFAFSKNQKPTIVPIVSKFSTAVNDCIQIEQHQHW